MRAFYDICIKRAFDFTVALIALILLSPAYLLLYVFVRLNCGTPVLFKQERPGKRGKPFTIYKFRSMADIYDDNGQLLPDEDRLSSFGIKLRALSLDELPELINILKGDMSFVGPRPLLTEYLPLYSERQAKRHNVRPGLTGLAQVSGRNLISWEDKFEYDVYYVEHENPIMDLGIIFKTAVNVIKKEGISSETAATMEAFIGSTPEAEEKAKAKILSGRRQHGNQDL